MTNPFIRKRYDGKKRDYRYGIAAYPTSHRGYVITPNKICVQFDNIVCKGRRLEEPSLDYIKVPNDPDGADVSVLSVGMYLPVFTKTLEAMHVAAKEYLSQDLPIEPADKEILMNLIGTN